MSAEIIPFDFEEQAVRVVMRGEDPWFVAADVCRVLELSNTTMAVKGLDDDEVTLSQIEGSHRETNLINESGLYALVIRSDKPAARRFRKWITSEVLPAIRRTGRYVHPNLPDTGGEVPGLDHCAARDAELWLSMIREARLLGGTRAGRSMWARSPLPQLVPFAGGREIDPEDARACLGHVRQTAGAAIARATTRDRDAERVLTGWGLRLCDGCVFLANTAHPGPAVLFAGTHWAGGAYRAALLSLGGVGICSQSLRLGGVSTRGILIPLDMATVEMSDA